MPTLSVISPAYNEELFITPFLESVGAQTEDNFEFIIIDDCSTDRTADLIEAYLPRLGRRVQFIRHDLNQGEMQTVTEAFSRASGDICIKVDADSILAPDAFVKMMETFMVDSEVGVVTASITAVDRSSWVSRGTEVLCVTQQRVDQYDASHTTSAYGTCFAFRRCIFSIEEIASRVDIDLSQVARKRGWKLVLRKDIKIRTRFPHTLSAAFARGRRMAWQELPTHWHHKEMLLTHWAFWAKFGPLGLVLVALFRPGWALLGLLAWLIGAQVFLAHQAPDYSWADRLAGWCVAIVRWSGFDLELLLMVPRMVARWLWSGERRTKRP